MYGNVLLPRDGRDGVRVATDGALDVATRHDRPVLAVERPVTIISEGDV